MKPARILLLTPSLDYGGAEVVISQLAIHLASLHWNVCVASMLPPRAFSEVLRSSGVEVPSLDMKPGRLNVPGILSLLALIRRFRPDVIHAHMFHANILARLLKPFLGIPVVCTAHSTTESARGSRSAFLRDWAYRLTNWGCDITTTVSDAVRSRYVSGLLAPSNRIETVPNGVDAIQFRPDPAQRDSVRTDRNWNGHFVWLTVGRLELAKDFPRLLEAFRILHQHHPSALLAIVGEGRLRHQLEALTVNHGLNGSVQFLGTRTDVAALLNGSDAFVLSSAWEGGPIVLLEAGASGKPIVSTAVGAAPQIVLHDQTGYLAPPEDTVALARAMLQLMGVPPADREAMGTHARRHVSASYSLERTHQAYGQVYERVLAANA